MSGFQTRFEGFLPPEPGLRRPRICVSQPQLVGVNPTDLEIEVALKEYGFQAISRHTYFQPDTKILLTDAAPRNVWIIQGIPVPFDAIAEIASSRVLEWSENLSA